MALLDTVEAVRIPLNSVSTAAGQRSANNEAKLMTCRCPMKIFWRDTESLVVMSRPACDSWSAVAFMEAMPDAMRYAKTIAAIATHKRVKAAMTLPDRHLAQPCDPDRVYPLLQEWHRRPLYPGVHVSVALNVALPSEPRQTPG
jgi:hypothetical protein